MWLLVWCWSVWGDGLMVDSREERREKWRRMPFCRKWLFASWKDAAFILIVLFLAWAYHHDHGALMEVYEDPCAYCACEDEGEWGDEDWTRDYGIVMPETRSLRRDGVT